jgi:hypothetical protein
MSMLTHRPGWAAALLLAALCATAQDTSVWNPAANPSGSSRWQEAANWTRQAVPDPTVRTVFNVAGAADCLVEGSAVAGRFVAGDNGPGGSVVVTNGASLTVGASDWSAVGYNHSAQLVVGAGGSVTFGHHLWVGFTSPADGSLILAGGTVSVSQMFGLGWDGGSGKAFVRSGSLILSQFSGAQSISANSVLDVEAGSVVIAGNHSQAVADYISAGRITAYGGTGTVKWDYGDTHPGKTTITATDEGEPPVYPVELLDIALANDDVVVSWPVAAGSYALLSASTLGGTPVTWEPVEATPVLINGTNRVTATRAGEARYFTLAPEVDPTTMNGKLLMGYQGWHSAVGDGSQINSWVHWFRDNTPTADKATFDFWPDTSEFDEDELFATQMTFGDGSPAKLYSAYTEKTVVRHFQWMRENQLDGVFFQRFLSDLNGASISQLRNKVVQNVRVGAETHGRVFAIMYDISGYSTNNLINKLTNDWQYLVTVQKVTNSLSYLHHKGKPVVAIWGFGFKDRPDIPAQAQQAIDWFKAAGCTVMGGVPTYWRTLTGDAESDPAWAPVFRSFDVLSPWTVGRFADNNGADNYRVNNIVPDLAECTHNGIDFLPVVFPGFSWSNLHGGPFNQIPRNGGSFYWRQIYNAVRSDCTMIYGAMFDEVDEGTAMYKLAPTSAQVPAQGSFVPLNVDGVQLGSDWYLRLADEAGRMLRGEIPVSSTIPISPP